MPLTPGKETAEEQLDQLLLSVTYFFQEHRKPPRQYHGTGIVVSYALDTLCLTQVPFPVFDVGGD